jgi:hypothetical protein
MDEHLEEKFKEWQVREEEIAQIEKSTNEKIAQYYKQSEPKIKGDWEYTKEEIEQTNLEEEV